MHRMKMIMEKLEEYVCEELEKDKSEICAKELGEVIDSIKDCTETMYYYTLYTTMEESSKWKKDNASYSEHLCKELSELMAQITPQEKDMLKKRIAEMY